MTALLLCRSRCSAGLSSASNAVCAQKKETANSLIRKGAQNAVHVLLVSICGGAAGALQLPDPILSLTQLRVGVLETQVAGEREKEDRESDASLTHTKPTRTGHP